MFWRAWSFLAGAPVGVLAALCFGVGSTSGLAACAATGAALWLGVASWIARARDDDPARPAHVASAASSGLASLAASGGALLHLSPGPGSWLALQLLASAAAFALASRRIAPSGGAAHQLRAALAWLVLGSCAVVASGDLLARLAPGPASDALSPEAIYDLDARVVTRALPACSDDGARVRVLHADGARPRLDPAGDALWFDAETDTGLRQLHRLDLAAGSTECVTCGEPGNNLRADPGGAGVLFETDRFASLADPANREIQLLRRDSGEPSRRLTRHPGPDTHALWAPGGGRVVWSRRERGEQVVWAPIQSAHGALRLGPPTLLARAGAAWVVPAAWSPDARSLVLLSGNPFRPQRAQALDPASGETRRLGDSVVPGGVSFSADGGRVVVAGARRARAAGLLPTALASPLAPLALAIARDGRLFRHTELSLGETRAALHRLRAPELSAWGAPTGVASSPDGTRIYLGQRAADGRERLVEIRLRCAP